MAISAGWIPWVMAGAMAVTVTPAEAAEEWPTFRGDPTHSGASNAGPAITAPRLAWRYDTGGVVESSAAVVNGVVYQGTTAAWESWTQLRAILRQPGALTLS